MALYDHMSYWIYWIYANVVETAWFYISRAVVTIRIICVANNLDEAKSMLEAWAQRFSAESDLRAGKFFKWLMGHDIPD